MYTFKGRFCRLEELTSCNDFQLFNLMRKYTFEYQYYISDEQVPNSYESFQRTLALWFKNGRSHQFLVWKNSGEQPIGTIFFYGLDDSSRSLKLSSFFVPQVRRMACVAEALGLALWFARLIMGIQEVMYSVYVENRRMHELSMKIGATRGKLSPSSVSPDRAIVSYCISVDRLGSLINKTQRLYRRLV